jgi:hypothetical protein
VLFTRIALHLWLDERGALRDPKESDMRSSSSETAGVNTWIWICR